jgi:hypothetical protein
VINSKFVVVLLSNSSISTDVFILGTDRRTVTVYLWNYGSFDT